MKAHIKISFILSFLLSFLLIYLPQSHVNAQDFLKKFLSNSSIKRGKQFKSDGDYPSAITAFTKSIKRKPENLEAYYQLGLIIEKVLRDYDKAISLYKSVITLSEGVNPVGTDEELKAFNSLITNTKESLDRAIGQKFESIEKPKVPVYIMIKPNKTIRKEPKMLSYSLHKTSSYVSEFKLLGFKYNWYQINVPSAGSGWINGKNVLKITQKEKKAIETSSAGKAALYQRFADLYPDSRFAQNAKDKADDIYYGLANEEGSINSYSDYLRKYPDSKYSEEVQLKKDKLTFEDKSLFNNINRLRHWITNNPKSTFLRKAENRMEELTFAQAKNDNNTVSLEGYIIDYPEGKFVSEAKQLLEDLKYNHAKLKDTINSYGKYLDEYPDGRYAENAAKRIDEKEFSALLNSQDIELLTEHVDSETNEERKGLVKNRIEELYFKKADGTNNDVDAIKMHEDYLQKYPDGIYVKEAEARIEELSFNIAARTNTKDAYRDFIKKYPQGKHYKEAIDGIEALDFNVALAEDTPESFKKFLMTYPDGEFAQTAKKRIEELAFEDAKTKDTINAYKEFATEYPGSHLAITAKNLIETGYFESASKKGTVKAYKEYITLYPDGSHLEKARLTIDMLTFKPYDEKGSVRSLKKFIRKHPESRYVTAAKQKIAKLTLIDESKSDESSFWIWMVILQFFSIAIITVVILKRERILQSISHSAKKFKSLAERSKGYATDIRGILERTGEQVSRMAGKTMTRESFNNVRFKNKSANNNSIPMQRLVKAENLCAIALIIFFFLPWVQLFGFSASGFRLAQYIGSYANLAWLIPVFSGITITIGLAGGSQREVGAITGFIPFVGLIYGLTKIGNNIFHVLSIGTYLTLIVSVAMILSAIGLINMPINNKKE